MPVFGSTPIDNISQALLSIRLGRVEGLSTGSLAAFSDNIGTTIQNISGNQTVITHPSTATVIAIASENVNDTSAGTGARTVLVSGLDADGNVQQQIVSMNGQTKVTATGTWTAINLMVVLSSGSSNLNEGQIHCGPDSETWTGGVPPTKFYGIAAGRAIGQSGVYTVPTGKKLLLVELNASGDPSKPVKIAAEVMTPSSETWVTLVTLYTETGGIAFDVNSGSDSTAGTILRFRAEAAQAGSDLTAIAAFVLQDV